MINAVGDKEGNGNVGATEEGVTEFGKVGAEMGVEVGVAVGVVVGAISGDSVSDREGG